MTWKVIGQSALGQYHAATGKSCEDSVSYKVIETPTAGQVLIGCASDGAGSASMAATASAYCTLQMLQGLEAVALSGEEITEAKILALIEGLYEGLEVQALADERELQDYSCTLMGCYITPSLAAWFQIGDGALVYSDGSNGFNYVWWPHNGEYLNTTTFVVDDPNLPNLHITLIEGEVKQVAMFTDGLQHLALNFESMSVHQPFFNDLFRALHLADSDEKITILNYKLGQYLNSDTINNRTDDDKTLLLATCC